MGFLTLNTHIISCALHIEGAFLVQICLLFYLLVVGWRGSFRAYSSSPFQNGLHLVELAICWKQFYLSAHCLKTGQDHRSGMFAKVEQTRPRHKWREERLWMKRHQFPSIWLPMWNRGTHRKLPGGLLVRSLNSTRLINQSAHIYQTSLKLVFFRVFPCFWLGSCQSLIQIFFVFLMLLICFCIDWIAENK